MKGSGKKGKGQKGGKKGSGKNGEVLKRPAAAVKAKAKQGKIADQFQIEDEEAKADHEEGEEEEKQEDDPEVDPYNAPHDRSKSARFFSMMRNSELPQAALQKWQESDSRSKQSALINQLFEKRGKKYFLKSELELPSIYAKTRETERSDRAEDVQSGFGEPISKRNTTSRRWN